MRAPQPPAHTWPDLHRARCLVHVQGKRTGRHPERNDVQPAAPDAVCWGPFPAQNRSRPTLARLEMPFMLAWTRAYSPLSCGVEG